MFKKLLLFSSLLSFITYSSASLSSDDKLMLKKDSPTNNDLKPLKKLSPKIHIIVKEPAPAVPVSLVAHYLQSDRLIDEEDYLHAYRVLGTSDGRQFLSRNERVYVDAKLIDKEWGIYRSVKVFSRHGHKKNAHALRLIAVAELAENNDKISGLRVTKQQQEILMNDVVLPIPADDVNSKLKTTFYPQPGPVDINISILGSIHGGDYLAVNQVMIIDRGSDDGLQQGSRYLLKEEGREVNGHRGEYYYDSNNIEKEGFQLPKIEIGELIVIRPYKQFSLALITRGERPINKNTLVISPKKGIDYE